MSSEKTGVPLLEGSANYVIWAIKMKSLLVREGLDKALDQEAPTGNQVDKARKALSHVILYCKPGPIIHIQNEEYAKPAQEKLKTLYNTQGFVSEFLLYNEFFNVKPENFKGLKAYLNEIQRLTEELKARKLKLPSQLVISWILSNLNEDFEGFVSNVTQAFRKDPKAYTFDTLTSFILDEGKRHKHKNQTNVVSKSLDKASRLKGKMGRISKKP